MKYWKPLSCCRGFFDKRRLNFYKAMLACAIVHGLFLGFLYNIQSDTWKAESKFLKNTKLLLMKDQPRPVLPGDNTPGKSLRLLVNHLVSDSLPATTRLQSHIVNEVPGHLRLVADAMKVVPVIDELLTTVVSNARNGEIHITAGRHRDMLTLEIQERNNYNGYALSSRILSMQATVHRIGGEIAMQDPQRLVTTITLRFPNVMTA